MALMCGRQVVLTAGQSVPLVTTPQVVDHVDIFAFDDNTLRVYVGCSRVRAASGMESGWPLSARESVTFKNVDLSTIWLDAREAGEGVSWGAEDAA